MADGMMPGKPAKNRSTAGVSYVVPCPSRFRDRVQALAEKQGVSPADLARSVLILVNSQTLDRHPDPGDPAPDDREAVKLQSGASAGRVLRRKPRIQMRLPAGHPIPRLRRALSVALATAAGEIDLTLVTDADRRAEQVVEKARDALSEENDGLRRLVTDLAMPILTQGITSRADALFILGFPPSALPDQGTIKRRWRRLAMIYHPDSTFGDHERMTQLNAAAERLL